MTDRHLLHLAVMLAAALACIALAIHAAPVVEAAPSQLGISVYIDLDSDVANARPTSSQNGPCMIPGNVTVEKLPTSIQRVTVTLSAEMNTEWGAILSPSTMVFTNDQPQQFYVTVVVPPATPVGSGKLTLTATAADPIQTATATAEATVIVLQYFMLTVTGEWDPVKVRPGDWVTGELRILNEGNGRDTVWVEIAEAHKSVWDFEVDEAVIINVGQMATVEFTFYTDEGYKPEDAENCTVVLRASSRTAVKQGMNYTLDIPVTFTFLTLKERLVQDWPVYVAIGAAVAVAAVVAFYGLRWWRAKRAGRGPRRKLIGRLRARVSRKLGRKA